MLLNYIIMKIYTEACSGVQKLPSLYRCHGISWCKAIKDSGIISYNEEPGIISYNEEPGIISYNEDSGIISYNEEPGIISYNEDSGIISYNEEPVFS